MPSWVSARLVINAAFYRKDAPLKYSLLVDIESTNFRDGT